MRLSCGPGEGLQISLIEEVSTCAYVFHVRTDRLCRHPAFEAERAKETSLYGAPLEQCCRRPAVVRTAGRLLVRTAGRLAMARSPLDPTWCLGKRAVRILRSYDGKNSRNHTDGNKKDQRE